jgi:hypothetical protein
MSQPTSKAQKPKRLTTQMARRIRIPFVAIHSRCERSVDLWGSAVDCQRSDEQWPANNRGPSTLVAASSKHEVAERDVSFIPFGTGSPWVL